MLHGVGTREPSDNKTSGGGGGDLGQTHSRLASGGPPPTGASPAGGGGGGAGPGPGPGPGGVLGMPGHSVMSTSGGGGGGGHLQAPSSTTPESSSGVGGGGGGGLGVGPTFYRMEPPLSISEIKQEIPAGSSTSAKLCQVCNDNASGFHYGVWSCEGCKAFFKRSIQGPVDYMCPATNNCTIDKHRRKSCQACRLRKCYEVGMNKGSQRKDRKSSGGSGSSTPRGKRCRADSTDAVNSTSGAGASKSMKRSQTASILEALQKADLPVLESYHNHDQPLDRVHLLNTLIKLADRELVYLINWAKHVPGYTDLSLSDQVHLIECCWMELLLLNCAFRSMDYDGRRLVFAPDFHLDKPLWVVMGMTEILEQVSAVTEQMVHYAVTKEEQLLLKATILVNAEVRRLASFDKIMEMRQMIVDALMEVAQKSHPEDTRRVPSLLLLLTHVRQAGERGIAYFQALKHGGSVAFCDLLTEMLDAHNSATSAAAAAAAAAATVTSPAVTASMPSTSSAGIDQKTLSLGPPHLPPGPS
uniref:Estrogen receptor n=1 Tax=Reishia clavigera TaxID=272940 RepID=Q86B27_REICL|nr:estrogen receptor [Reishia clavigera]